MRYALSTLIQIEITTMEDSRCCGTGTCIINADGYCWCGQKWDGTKMCFPDKAESCTDGEAARADARRRDEQHTAPSFGSSNG